MQAYTAIMSQHLTIDRWTWDPLSFKFTWYWKDNFNTYRTK